MPYVIDGNNLGGALGGRSGSRGEGAIVRLLLPWARKRGRVILCFDGPAAADVADRYGPLEVRWSGKRSADEAILTIIAAKPREWRVVTDDRRLAEQCRAAGAQWIPTRELLDRLPQEESETKAPAPVDVAEWEEYFRTGN